MDEKWWVVKVNPEPWAIGTVRVNKIAPNPNLVSYQAAVREELEGEPMLPDDYRKITFYFFRQIEKYIDAADRVKTRNVADATNLQKGLEDALQGILFENDREVVDIRSVMCMQTTDLDAGFTIIRAQAVDRALHGVDEIPGWVMEHAFAAVNRKSTDRWQEADDIF